ncbi:MAG: hypothetical protein P8J89_11075 [Phycisphaerales bacterium]|nr:hypothetical protein [Phycisphaerales bacterium]|tara:strand:+ start:11370 stop:11738 length:369 start_codon:yes stop_codon:yes gene_type:complete
MTNALDPKQGFVSDRTNEAEFAAALAAAVDYRGDVTVTLDNDSEELGYLFDLTGDMHGGNIGFMTKEDSSPRRVSTSTIKSIMFTGRDTAEGKSFDTWIKKYVEKKIAGQKASIECDDLDDD